MSPTTLAVPRRHRWVPLVWLVVLIIGMAAAFWAGQVTSRPAAKMLEQPAPVTYTVQEDTISQELDKTASAQWPDGRAFAAGRSGTLTSIDLPADGWVRSGDVVATINLRPLVAASGTIPMFREIGPQVTGPDVRQLQQLLQDKGFAPTTSGTVDQQTTAAIRAWQESLGHDPTGTVIPGEVVFLPQLPVRAHPAAEIHVGSLLTEQSPLLVAIAAEPVITVSILSQQSGAIPTSGSVEITYQDRTWQGKMAAGTVGTDGSLTIPLVATDGSPICGKDCESAIKLGEPNFLPMKIIVTPRTTGPAIPVSAITTGPDGKTTVTAADGTIRQVTVRASANGMAVVDNIAVGEQVLLPPLPAKP